MKKNLIFVLLSILLLSSCGSAVVEEKQTQKLRVGGYQVNTTEIGKNHCINIYDNGKAGYLGMPEMSHIEEYSYDISDGIVRFKDSNGEAKMTLEITNDGNLKMGDEIYCYRNAGGF